jgi:hypothetical protein
MTELRLQNGRLFILHVFCALKVADKPSNIRSASISRIANRLLVEWRLICDDRGGALNK